MRTRDEPFEQEPTEPVRFAARVRAMRLDTRPLRVSRDYRLVFFSSLVSETGHQVTLVAVFYQLYRLTGSAAAVGLVGLVQLIPLMVATLLGGPLVDRKDRRTLFLATQAGLALTSAALLLGAVAGNPPVAVIYGIVAVEAALAGIASPTRTALVPNLVPRELLPTTIALNYAMWTTAQIAGPAIAGVVIAKAGLGWAYLIDVVTYGATIGAALAMRPHPPERGDGAATGLAAVRESFTFLRGRRVLKTTFYVDLIAMIFGMPRALFPVIAVTQFHRGAEVVGGLFSAVAAGALAGTLTSGWVSGVRRHGLAVIVAVAVWGASIAGFGAAGDRLWLAFVLLAVAGGADAISAVFRGTILQSNLPDAIRGRISGVHILVVTGGPRLGDVEAGLVAEWFGAGASIVSGGIACVVGVLLLAVMVPEFRRYRALRE